MDLGPFPAPDLAGKVVAVVGASGGIGRATVSLLKAAGAEVVAGLFSDGAVAMEDVDTVRFDITSGDSIDAFFSRVNKRHGRLDAFINNAAVVTPIGRASDVDADGFRKVMEVNATGALMSLQKAIPMLLASKGVAINASSGAASRPMEGWVAYCASKAAMVMVTRVFDLELRDRGVRLFACGIPPTDTLMQQHIRESRLNPISRIPRDDLLPPEVPASALVWLCGPRARDIEEVVIDVRDEQIRDLARAEA